MLRVAVLCVVLATTWALEKCLDMGVLGTICDKRYCPMEDAFCDGDKCTCWSGRGQPELLCSNDDDYFASVINDPQAFTMNNRESADIPVPCKYLFTHVSTKVKTSNSPNGECEIKVFLYNTRIRGKLFVGRFDIDIACKNMNDNAGYKGRQNLLYRADAHVNSEGKYCFNLQVSDNNGVTFNDDLQNNYNKIDRAYYIFGVDENTNKAWLQIDAAGVIAQLRPFDPKYGVFDQKWLPGFAVRFYKDKDVTFKSADKVVSLVPGTTLRQAAGPDRTPTDELTNRAFQNNEITSFGMCYFTSSTLGSCPQANKALPTCRFILTNAKFVNCYGTPDSSETEKMKTLYWHCLLGFCYNDPDYCAQFRTSLRKIPPTCQAHVPQELINHSCTF